MTAAVLDISAHLERQHLAREDAEAAFDAMRQAVGTEMRDSVEAGLRGADAWVAFHVPGLHGAPDRECWRPVMETLELLLTETRVSEAFHALMRTPVAAEFCRIAAAQYVKDNADDVAELRAKGEPL